MSINLTISDRIQIISIISSLITAIVAIVISIKTLRQNSKMIENSTRPYIGIYISSTYIRDVNVYLVVKNFGQGSALIQSFTYDFDLSKCYKDNISGYDPFNNIENSFLLPGQSQKCVIDLNKTLKQAKEINFHVVYSSGVHQYEEDICVNLEAHIGNYISHNATKNKELEIISETLQDMHIHSL